MRPEEIEIGKEYLYVPYSIDPTLSSYELAKKYEGSKCVAKTKPYPGNYNCNVCKQDAWVKTEESDGSLTYTCCCSLYPTTDPDHTETTTEEDEVNADIY